MKEQVYVPDPLNEQASTLVDAQTDIKLAIKRGVLSGYGKEYVKAEVRKIIDRAIARIRSPTLKEDARKSLMQFADRAYSNFVQTLGISLAVIASVIVIMRSITAQPTQSDLYVPKTPAEVKAVKQIASAEGLSYKAFNKGLPLQEFQKTYMQRVSSALQSLAEENALDPNDFTGRNSLRNLAEMQVRYERHQSEIAEFKTKGTKLVVCSVHADCSDRCAQWQGRVYSLDGTVGVTEDGQKYIPLEIATDVFYTTKAGRTYKNGLLGFNCRHKLVEYKNGMVIPSVSEQEQKREYAVTQRQRVMERGVIIAREQALINKNTGNIVLRHNGEPLINKKTGKPVTQYQKWRTIAQKRYKAYREFSTAHNRAYYPDRVKIL